MIVLQWKKRNSQSTFYRLNVWPNLEHAHVFFEEPRQESGIVVLSPVEKLSDTG